MESDEFMNLSREAQILYVFLNLNADDEGFVNNAKRVMAFCDCEEKDLDELIYSGYVIRIFPTVLVITHWHLHNNVPKDKFRSTIIENWQSQLDLVDKVYRPKGRINDHHRS